MIKNIDYFLFSDIESDIVRKYYGIQEEQNYENFIIWDSEGDYYQRYKKWFVDKDIVGLLDNSSIKQGEKLDGHIIMSPLVAIRYNSLIMFIYLCI